MVSAAWAEGAGGCSGEMSTRVREMGRELNMDGRLPDTHEMLHFLR
jgi:hypothetical protein